MLVLLKKNIAFWEWRKLYPLSVEWGIIPGGVCTNKRWRCI